MNTNNIKEIKIIPHQVKNRAFRSRKYTFYSKPKLIEFKTIHDLYFLAQKFPVVNFGKITKAEICEALNVTLKPKQKKPRKHRLPPLHTCAEKPTEIEPCSLHTLRCLAEKKEIKYRGLMTKAKLCEALNVYFKK